MTPTQLIADIERAGIELRVDSSSRLRYRPCARMTPELLTALRLHKTDVIATLRAESYTEADCRVLAEADLAPGDMPLLDAGKSAFPDAIVVRARRAKG